MDKAEQPTITQAQYESAVKGRQDFRNAYRNLLPVMRAAEGIVAIWRAKGRKVDVTEYWDAINAIDVAVTGGGAKPDPEHLTRTTSPAAQDGLVAEIERQEGLVKTYRGAQLRAEEKLCREQANAQGWKRRAEILESKLAALSAIKEQHHD